jgi:regulator of RNase E activity RraA
MVVEPGDLVLGDDDGLLCIPFGALETVYAAARAKHQAEERMMGEIRAGTVDRAWVDDSLKRLGCEMMPTDWRSACS